MAATHCLGGFAQKLQRLPRAEWKAQIDQLPEKCPNGCGVNCRDYCASFARVQWRLLAARGVK